MSRAELILYASPVGPLADSLDQLYRHLSATGPTTAQEYPPHCTLTGFFDRDTDQIPRIGRELDAAVAEVGPQAEGAVRVVNLHRRADWVGLEIESHWLHDLTERFIALHRCGEGDDALRPKDWLHLSIAYGVGDLRVAIENTVDFDHEMPVDWEVALWQRHGNGAWTREAVPTLGDDD